MKLKDHEYQLIREEEQILEMIQKALQKRQNRSVNTNQSLSRHLEDLREEASKARTDDLPALFDQMNTQRALLERKTDPDLPDPRSPYFAHMKLQEEGKNRDILLGHRTFLEVAKLPLIDWRNAPISRIFFNYREGEEFEEELPGRLAEGEILARRILSIHNGVLHQIITPEASYHKNSQGEWQRDQRHSIPRLQGGAGSASRSQHLGTGQTKIAGPEVSALLDPFQFSLLNSSTDEPLLVLGGAGCGKTTVALHRIALLHFRDAKRFAQNQILVVVPEQGLVRLSRKLLESLGLHDVEVRTFDEWIERQARVLIRNLPKRVCDATPTSVIQFKRHPAIRSVFPLLIQNQIDHLCQTLPARIPGIETCFDATLKNSELPLLDRIDLLESCFLDKIKERSGQTADQRSRVVRTIFQKLKKDLLDMNRDRNELFSNEKILQKVVENANGQLKPSMVNAVLSHSLDQFASSSQQDYAGFDQDKIAMVDGRSLVEESKSGKFNTIDVEDFAILLELLYYKTGQSTTRHGKFRTYSHIVVDEAQDLAPIELNVLSRTMRPDTAITIAGDAAQQIDPSTTFESWEQILDELKTKRVKAQYLKTTYRSTREIAKFAYDILGPLAPSEPPKALRDGVPVTVTPMANDGQVSLFLNEALTNLMMDEPHASVAIITKTEEFALRLYQVLKDVPKVRFVENGEFDFRPGVEITTADQVKGLEFDYVIIPDAGDHFYKDKPEDRRLLHVAATRAIHQLWVMTLGKPSKLLPMES